MILTGSEIKRQVTLGNIQIEGFSKDRLNPNSYNLRLAPKLLTYREAVLDPRQDNRTEEITIPEDGLTLRPGRLYLAQTMEYTKTDGFVPMLEGRSSVGRLGLLVHVTAGFGDVGFSGRWTLEMSCIEPVKVYAGMEICQIYYHTLYGRVEETYQGKYQDSDGVTASLLFLEDG